jgi:outer membrane protein
MRSSILLALVAFGVAQAQPAMRLTLAEAQRLAIQNNPQFSGARFTAAAANQVPNQYKANLLPNLSGNFTSVGADNGSRIAAGGLNNPVVYDRVGSGLTISQLVTDFGRTSNLIGMAKLQAAAQDQVAETTRADILLATSSAYFTVLSAQSVLKVVGETVKARQTVVDQVTALVEIAKRKSTLDLSFANVNLSGAKLLLVQAQNELKAAEARLAAAMGLPGESTFVLADEPMPPAIPDRVQSLIDAAIQNRPELKDLRLQQSAAERLTKAEHALFFPSVGVLGTAGFAPAAEAQIPGRYGAIGLNISVPIFNGGLFRARQTEAELKAKAAGENVNDLQNRVIRDVRIAFVNANTAFERMALTQELVKQAQLAMDLAQNRYELGLSDIVELSQAQLNLTSAQIANTTAMYDYQAQRINVDYQTGALH